MKLKEICAQTGLSRKTIRLYEEKGLLVPHKERRNGREYREYTEADVHTLKEIATLRRAWFTMEEIRRMQADPAAIQEIFPQYRQWLLLQKSQLDGLILAAEKIDLSEISSVSALSTKIEAETRRLPLPLADVNPHFKYLDEMEEVRTMKNEDTQKTMDARTADTRAFRQVTLTMDRDRVNDLAIPFGQVRDWESGAWNASDGPVIREEKEPKWMRVLTIIGILLAVIGFLVVAVTEVRDLYTHYDNGVPKDVIFGISALVLGVVLSLSLRGVAAYRERKRWLQVVRQQDEEKRNK